MELFVTKITSFCGGDKQSAFSPDAMSASSLHALAFIP